MKMTRPTNKWAYQWDVRDNGLYIWENGVKIAVIDPIHFKYLLSDLAEHLKWQEENNESTG